MLLRYAAFGSSCPAKGTATRGAASDALGETLQGQGVRYPRFLQVLGLCPECQSSQGNSRPQELEGFSCWQFFKW